MRIFSLLISLIVAIEAHASDFREIPTEPTPGDKILADYFARETKRLAIRTGSILESSGDWTAQQANLRRQLYEMLGLQPLPARSELQAEITGTTERDGIVVENIVFQSRPGLYVTANFYRPSNQEGPLPTILYSCGHAPVKESGVSFGNKSAYQHHGTWFAKNGYTCLMIDTLQLGEIEGIHHGTHREERWWWNARGYTPAGVEAWNAIRALDYLETRDEVDPSRFGATGRSGGGAYTWYLTALDERIQVAAPVAGITTMHNHVVDGCIEGHCDCMFMVNTYRWDFPLLASLVAPRPLLILNTDKDKIFPLDGVTDIYTKTRLAYERMRATEKLGLAITEGPHKDTQTLRVNAFHWFERHLKGADLSDELADTTAPKEFSPKKLRVLSNIPKDERNTYIDEYFTRRIPRTLTLPEIAADWNARQALIRNRLDSRSFRGWPSGEPPLHIEKNGNRVSFDSQTGLRLSFDLTLPDGKGLSQCDAVSFRILEGGAEKAATAEDAATITFAPRGIGPTAWTSDEKERTHIRRRFALLGQTIDGMQLWDIRRAIQAYRTLDGAGKPELTLEASGTMAGNALYAVLYEPDIAALRLEKLPSTHREGPIYLNVLRYTDLQEVAAIVGANSQLTIQTDHEESWEYLRDFAEMFGWPEGQLRIEATAAAADL